jgi:endonuclease G
MRWLHVFLLVAWGFTVKGQSIRPETFGKFSDSPLPRSLSGETTAKHSYFALSYNALHKVPNWVQYRLSIGMLSGSTSRSNDFRADPRLDVATATNKDFYKSGYDKGHMLPAGDMVFSDQAMSETFYLSNMCPQKPSFNRGIWRVLEDQVRSWAVSEREIYVVTGPILHGNSRKMRGTTVTVPDYFYKVVLDLTPPEYKAIGFIMENEGSERDLNAFAVSVDEVERQSGIDFFPALPDSLENAVEGIRAVSKWNFISQPVFAESKSVPKKSDKPRCRGITKKGARCSFSASYGAYCKKHIP